MKIISWNCSGKFRDKFTEIGKYGADIYVIQECENPEKTTSLSYKQFAMNYIWKGDLPYKGLGVFAKPDISLDRLKWSDHLLRHFIPIKVNNSFTLLAVWACNPYIEEYAVYQDIYFDNFDQNMVIIGDFNSNKVFDTKYRLASYRSHSAVVENLAGKGLYSAYHSITKENHGEETTSTFYLHRNKDKPHHIDYCFVSSDRINSFSILQDDWLNYSDHIPLMIDLK